MKIVVLCWGSLYWDLRGLELSNERWEEDGPRLPLEFCRISSDGRATLVINENGNICTTYWQIHKYQNLDEAKKNLKKREGCNIECIGSITQDEPCSKPITKSIHSWLLEKPNIDAVIWTNLESNWPQKRGGEDFSIESLRRYLEESKSMSHWEKIEKYFVEAPPQTQTDGRKLFDDEFRSKCSDN